MVARLQRRRRVQAGTVNAPTEHQWRLAIDFGTTSTAAAMTGADGRPTPLVLESSSFTMPSGVLILDGQVHTGLSATRLAAANPSGYEPTPKRHLGEDEILLDGVTVSPLALIGAVLARVYQAALRQRNGVPPLEVVLTHPEAWRGHRLERLREAAVGAGIPADRIRMVSEPVAAAWHYTAADLRPLPQGALLGVLDFGGGTLDLALLRYELRDGAPRFFVLDQDGIDTLGGHDFDTKLMEWTLDQLRNDDRVEMADALAAGGPEVLYDKLVVRDQVRQAKHMLSEHASAPLVARAAGREWVGTATRGEFVDLIAGDLDRTVALLEQLLRRNDAGDGLHTLYLTGGSTHIPALHHRLERLLPGRVATLDDPKQVTSLGALRVPARYAPGSMHATASAATTAHVPTPVPVPVPVPVPQPPPGRMTPQDRTPVPTPHTHAAGSPVDGSEPWTRQNEPVGPEEARWTSSQEPGATGGRRSSRAGWAIVGGVVGLCAVAGIVASLTSTRDPGGTSNGSGSSSSQELDADALIAVLPDGFSDCDLIETTTGSIRISCSIDDDGVPLGYAWVEQYESTTELLTEFSWWADSDRLTPDPACRESGSAEYTAAEKVQGLCACGTADGEPQLVWTQTDINLLVITWGETGTPPGPLNDWFWNLPVLSHP